MPESVGDEEDLASSLNLDEDDLTSSMLQDENEDGDDEYEDEESGVGAPKTPEQAEDRRLEDLDVTPRKSSDLPNGKAARGLGVG